jgi:hypothetical protein
MAVRVRTYEPPEGGARALDARDANDRIAEKARRLHFLSRVPMLCECSSPGCRTIVMVGLDDFDEMRRDSATFLAAPGHEDHGTQLERETPGYTVRRSAYDGRNGGRRSA